MKFGLEETEAPAKPAAKRIKRGTDQQEAFWAELRDGTGHVLLEARAGTGKSTSCREGMWRLLADKPSLSVRYCCFNKAIADEFAASCPPGVEVGTMHRFGLQALSRSFGSKVDGGKTYAILDAIDGGTKLKGYVRRSIGKLVGQAKNHGLSPDLADLEVRLSELADVHDVPTWGQEDKIVNWAARVLAESFARTDLADFDDMLWLPVGHGLDFPGVDYLFIDECQDLNPLQHELAERLSGSGRTVIVGDPFQAIYGWRGAATDSIPRLRDRLGAKVLPLTVTWRCPRSHVELARRLVPDFEAAPEAPEGTLVEAGPGVVEAAAPGDLVLCRANAPIVSACLKAVAAGRPAYVRGRSIGEGLIGVLRKADRGSRTVAELVRAIAVWRAQQLAVLAEKDDSDSKIETVMDQTACLEAIASSCQSPADVPTAIARLFDDAAAKDRITFSSVHRAKGSEARDVTYIQVPYSESRDKKKPPQPWELQQRTNLRYVALTRSLDTLVLTTNA